MRLTGEYLGSGLTMFNSILLWLLSFARSDCPYSRADPGEFPTFSSSPRGSLRQMMAPCSTLCIPRSLQRTSEKTSTSTNFGEIAYALRNTVEGEEQCRHSSSNSPERSSG